MNDDIIQPMPDYFAMKELGYRAKKIGSGKYVWSIGDLRRLLLVEDRYVDFAGDSLTPSQMEDYWIDNL